MNRWGLNCVNISVEDKDIAVPLHGAFFSLHPCFLLKTKVVRPPSGSVMDGICNAVNSVRRENSNMDYLVQQ